VRNYNTAVQLNKYFDLQVITNDHLSSNNQKTLDSDIKVYRVFTLDEFSIKKRLNKSKGGKKNVRKQRTPFEPKVGLIKRWVNSFPLNFMVWEGGLLYVLGSLIRMIKLKPEIVYSSYSPMSDHYVCFLYKIWNKQVFWIADFRDLHIDPEVKNVVFFKFQYNLEKWMFGKADLITSVSNGLAGHLSDYNDKLYVLRNGIPENTNMQKEYVHTDKFRMTYTGMLYNGRRDPGSIFKAVRELVDLGRIDQSDIVLEYAGKEGGLWAELASEYGLENCVLDHGLVSYEQSLRMQRLSSINILLSWATPKQKGILTGKFYEYLVANKPIILSINGVEDEEFSGVMKELNAGLVMYNDDIVYAKNFILDHYLAWRNEGYTSGVVKEKVLDTYRWNNLIKNLRDIIPC